MVTTNRLYAKKITKNIDQKNVNVKQSPTVKGHHIVQRSRINSINKLKSDSHLPKKFVLFALLKTL